MRNGKIPTVVSGKIGRFVKPNVYIIAGPNGAGKTTFAREFLPLYADCKNFINADLIAQGMSPFSPESAAFHAGRLMLGEIDHLSKRAVDFGFETTLSGHAHLHLIRRLRDRGYKVHFFYLWVPNVEFAVSRVRERVLKGGHDVPETVILRRFERSIRNFMERYRPLGEAWTIFNNTGNRPKIIAFEFSGKVTIIDQERYAELSNRYGSI